MLLDILEEHIDDASHLHDVLHGERESPDDAADARGEFQTRLDAHIQALAEAPGESWKILTARLGAQRPGDYYVLARLAERSPIDDHKAQLRGIRDSATGAVLRSIQIAVGVPPAVAPNSQP